jgi:LPXTG-motif cell wall-anchored protein
MRWSVPAGVLMALAFLVPAAQAVAEPGSPVLNQACQPVERKVYKDIRELITIDLNTASDIEVRVLANQILSVARAESLTGLPTRIQERLDGTADDLREFLKTNLLTAWNVDLRVAVVQTLPGAGPHVNAAAQTVLDNPSIDAYLAYLNDGLYVARALDCASASASPSPSASASASPSPSASASTSQSASVSASSSVSSSAAGTLPTTGTNTGLLALGGAALILFGSGVVLVARRFRT